VPVSLDGVWLWLSFRPWWVQWPVYVLVLALTVLPIGALGDYPDDRGTFSRLAVMWVVSIIVGALVFGLVLAVRYTRRLAVLPPAMAKLSVRGCREVSRALTRGPVPVDPVIRQAAVLLAERAVGSTRSTKFVAVVLAVNVLLQVVSFLVNPHHFTLLGIALIVFLSGCVGYYSIYANLLEARLELLRVYPPAIGQPF
jgi:hypothetical protein